MTAGTQFFAGRILQQIDVLGETGPYVNAFPSPQMSQRAPRQELSHPGLSVPAMPLTFCTPAKREGVCWQNAVMSWGGSTGLSPGETGQVLQG